MEKIQGYFDCTLYPHDLKKTSTVTFALNDIFTKVEQKIRAKYDSPKLLKGDFQSKELVLFNEPKFRDFNNLHDKIYDNNFRPASIPDIYQFLVCRKIPPAFLERGLWLLLHMEYEHPDLVFAYVFSDAKHPEQPIACYKKYRQEEYDTNSSIAMVKVKK